MEVGAFIRFEAPVTVQGSGHLLVKLCAFDGVRVDEKSAAGSVSTGGELQVFAVLARDGEIKVVANVGREYERCALCLLYTSRCV